MSFRVGQRVVCVCDSGWKYATPIITTTGWWLWKKTTITHQQVCGPSMNEVCRIIEINEKGYLRLSGYAHFGYYCPDGFRPLSDLEEQLERIESEGAPVELEPQTA
jgi:hypothetical protein